MNRLHHTSRFGSVQIILHWITFFIIVAVYACIELKGFFPKGSAMREFMKASHFTLGLTVLVLAVVRLVVHFAQRSHRSGVLPPRWQLVLRRVMHVALYAFMIAMPILGWLLLSTDSQPIPFYGIEVFPIAGADSVLAERVEELHETIGTVGYALIGLHAGAALMHHYFFRDDTLMQMLPRWGAGRRGRIS